MSKKITQEMFLRRVAERSPTTVVLGDYRGCDTPVECECRICNNVWRPIPRSLYQGSQCPKCAVAKRAEKRKRTHDSIVNELSQKNPHVELIEEITSTQDNVAWRCKECGSVWRSRLYNLLDGNTHCAKCSRARNRERTLLPEDVFLKRVAAILPDVTVMDKFDGYYVKLRCKCNKHNTYFSTTPHSLLGCKCGCPVCNETHGERKMKIALENLGVNITQQYTFDDCADRQKLKFDAFSKETNTAFEYQGEQHYRVVDFSGRNAERAKSQFYELRKRDDIKRSYCKEHGIKLIEVPYWEYDNMDEFLSKRLTDTIKNFTPQR